MTPGAPLEIRTAAGSTYARGLARMYFQHGFPLSCALDECARREWVPCLVLEAAALVGNGFTGRRARNVIDEALRDMTCAIPASWSSDLAWWERLKQGG